MSLRSLARRLGVSHAAPANHFPDKASLFTAIAIEGFRLLAAAIEDGARRLGPDATAGQRFRAAGHAYTSFAIAHPAHFAVMWQRDLLHQDDPELAAAGDTTFELLLQGVRDAQAEGWAPAATPRPWPCWPGRWCTAWPPCGSAAPSSGPSGPSTRSPARSAPCWAAPSAPDPTPPPPERDSMHRDDRPRPTQLQPRPTDTRLRVGDAERTLVIDQLADHHAAGRLTLEEFEDRMASAWTARTGADLAPGPGPPGAGAVPGAGPPPGRPPPPRPPGQDLPGRHGPAVADLAAHRRRLPLAGLADARLGRRRRRPPVAPPQGGVSPR